jgi:hypothetical protein
MELKGVYLFCGRFTPLLRVSHERPQKAGRRVDFSRLVRGPLMTAAYIELIQTATSRTGSVLYERETGRPMARVASSA